MRNINTLRLLQAARLPGICAFFAIIAFVFIACDDPASGPPALSGTVRITGIAQVGQSLRADTSALGGSGTITFQWKRGGAVVVSNSSTYTVQIGDVNSTITVKVIRSHSSGSITSTPTVPVIPATAVAFSSAAANGSSTETTRQLTLNFSQAITGLAEDDIILSGVSDIQKGTLAGSGATYTLPISGFTSGGTLTVDVEKAGYTISGAPKTVTIFYATSVSFNSVTANGSATQRTTNLLLSFDQAISGLTADDITLSGVSGVQKGTLSLNASSGRSYILPISGFAESGTLTVAVEKSGFTIGGSPKTVTIFVVDVAFNSISADGSATQPTTQLTLTFSRAISGLTADDITVSGVSGVQKGTLSGSGPTYTLPISGFAESGTLTVAVAKSGFAISGSSKTVAIFYATAVAFNSVSANGSATQTTTQLTLTFSQAISGLTADDITVSGVSGVQTGTLSGSGPTYTLPISGFSSGGTLTVAVEKSGFSISGSPKTVAILYAVTFNNVTANGSATQSTSTTQLTLTFSQAVSGLTADDITVSGVSGVQKGTLSGFGPTYTLPISGFTESGTLTVAVAKLGFVISGSSKTVSIQYAIPVTFISVTTNGSATQSTTELTLTFSQAISGLTADDITLSGVSGVSKGALNGSGLTYTLYITTTSSGTLTMAVSKSGFDISGSQKTVSVYAVRPNVEMVWVPGGTFWLGHEVGTAGSGDETPVSRVTLTGFYMGKYEVTQEQYQAVMGSNPSYFHGGSGREPATGETQGRRPVDGVTWNEATAFCNKLSMMEGLTPVYSRNGSTDPAVWGAQPWYLPTIVSGSTGYRLPTEAQWEYAAKGGNGTPDRATYSGSNNLDEVAWYVSNSESRTHEVGKKAPNGLGLYDMSGNVFEWCWDYPLIYSSEAKTDPTGPDTHHTGARVIRGGYWRSRLEREFMCLVLVRRNSQGPATYRYVEFDYGVKDSGIGFRLVRP